MVPVFTDKVSLLLLLSNGKFAGFACNTKLPTTSAIIPKYCFGSVTDVSSHREREDNVLYIT